MLSPVPTLSSDTWGAWPRGVAGSFGWDPGSVLPMSLLYVPAPGRQGPVFLPGRGDVLI